MQNLRLGVFFSNYFLVNNYHEVLRSASQSCIKSYHYMSISAKWNQISQFLQISDIIKIKFNTKFVEICLYENYEHMRIEHMKCLGFKSIICKAVTFLYVFWCPIKIFFLIYLFIYFWLCWVFVSVWGLPLVAASRGHSSSRCAGLSLSRPLLLRSTGSRCTSSAVVAHGLSCSAACGIFPDQGSNPCALYWQADSQPLHHQGSPPLKFNS